LFEGVQLKVVLNRKKAERAEKSDQTNRAGSGIVRPGVFLTGLILVSCDTDHVLQALSLVNAACDIAAAASMSFRHRVGGIVSAAPDAHALLFL